MKRGGPRITEVGWRIRDTFLLSLVVSWYQDNCKAVGLLDVSLFSGLLRINYVVEIHLLFMQFKDKLGE